MQRVAEECEDGGVELFRPLQRGEVAYVVESDEVRVRKTLSEIFRVFALYEFVVLALYDHDRHADLCEVVCGVVGLGLLHQGEVSDEVFESIGRRR